MLFYLLVLLPAAVLCRESTAPLVIGGVDAAEGAWPWQLSLRYGGSHSCGATLIGAQKAVCAAHCVGNAVAGYLLIAGTNQRSCPGDACTTSRISAYVRHPDYVENGNIGYPNDVSVLAIAGNPILPAPGKIAYATLATGTNQIGTTCFISGWGRTSSTGALPENLKEAQIDVLTTAECIGYWSAAQVTDNHICIFDKTNQAKGACNGDSGGPLVCQTGSANRYELAGATSWGRTGCSTAYPSVYTRISSYVDWINAQ